MTTPNPPTDPPPSAYLDYAAILSPTFHPPTFANTLVHQTNNPTDTPLDLATPLSRVLFDAQEVDTHLDTLTTTHAQPLIAHTQTRHDASTRVLGEVETAVASLNESYARLEREVAQRYEAAEQVRLAAERMVATLRLGRSVQRVVQLGRTLEGQLDEVGREGMAAPKGGWKAMGAAAETILGLRGIFAIGGVEGRELARVNVVGTVRTDLLGPAERTVLNRAQGTVRDFSLSSLVVGGGSGQGAQTFAQAEETKARATSAMNTLYLLSPTKVNAKVEGFEPTLLMSAVQGYLHVALTSSLASLTRALATLPTLDRVLLEISARCQNIVALESLLEATQPPVHPLLVYENAEEDNSTQENFLQPVLRHLDTSSLPSYFWRSLAGQLSSKVQEILNRGGVSARTLRSNRDRVRDAIRECVDRGSQNVDTSGGRRGDSKVGGWEREAAVMVGSVIGPLGR